MIDHDTGLLIWAAPGRDKKILRTFSTALGERRCQQITHVSRVPHFGRPASDTATTRWAAAKHPGRHERRQVGMRVLLWLWGERAEAEVCQPAE